MPIANTTIGGSDVGPTVIGNWFRLVENTIVKYDIRLSDTYNFDETSFVMGFISSRMAVTGIEKRGNPKSAGRPWHSSQLQANIASLADIEKATFWESGYCLLILDGHESHRSVDLEKYCEDNHIIALRIPAHSPHLLQPLDSKCFGLLKKVYGREIEHPVRYSITYVSQTNSILAIYAVRQIIMTGSNTKEDPRGTMLVSLDVESLISKLDMQLRGPTLIEKKASLPDP